MRGILIGIPISLILWAGIISGLLCIAGCATPLEHQCKPRPGDTLTQFMDSLSKCAEEAGR